jgi:hypothetical protein
MTLSKSTAALVPGSRDEQDSSTFTSTSSFNSSVSCASDQLKSASATVLVERKDEGTKDGVHQNLMMVSAAYLLQESLDMYRPTVLLPLPSNVRV